MRNTNVFYRCDFCSRVVTTTICPADWLEFSLKFDDGITDVPDVLVKHLCKGCAKQAAEVMFPLKPVPFSFAATPYHGEVFEKLKDSKSLKADSEDPLVFETAYDNIVLLGSAAEVFPTFEQAAQYVARYPRPVEVDAGYRTAEVLEACRKYGWKAFKRVRNLGDPEIKTVKRYVDLTTGEVLP